MADLNHLFDLARTQHGLLTRRQLSEAELTRAQRRSLFDRGELVPIGRRTLRVAGAPRTVLQRVAFACMDTGGHASHRTSSWMHVMNGFGAPEVPEVTVGRRSYSYDHQLVRVHTTTNLTPDDLVSVSGIPCLSVARTLFSLAALVPEIPLERVKGAVDDAVARGMARDAWLWARLEALRCRGRNGVTVFEQVLAERAGGLVTESWLERETLRVLRAAGLPEPRCQQRVERQGAFVARVDFLYPEQRIVIEVSGHAWHSSREQVVADVARRRQLVLAGYTVLEFTYDDVTRRPQTLVSEVRAALQDAARPAA